MGARAQESVHKFFAPAGTELHAMTRYFVVVKNAEILIASTALPWQRAAATGWTLERGLWMSIAGSDYNVTFDHQTSSLRMRVWGSQTAEQRTAVSVPEEPEAPWPCDSNGDGKADGRDRETIAIVGGGTTFASAAQRIEEGQEEGRNIAIQITKASPATGDCWAEPDAPWVATLRLTRRATGVLTPRVSESQLADRRIEIHRNQQTVTVTIEVEDNDIPQGETIIEAELVRHADTHEQLMIQNAKKRFAIYDEDPFEVFFDLPCDEDMRVTEGDRVARIPLRVTPAPESSWSLLVLNSGGSAITGTDFVRPNRLVLWEGGQETAEFQITLVNNEALEVEENLNLILSRNGLKAGGRPVTCPGATASGKTVVIVDDDRAVMQMGPQRRSVAPGETIRFVASYDLGGRCPVPLAQLVRPTISAGASELKTVPTEPTRYSHCASELVLEYETKERQCGDHGSREIRFRFTIDDPDERISIEHDEYVVRVENSSTDYAKLFTTGGAAHGYVLDKIDVGIRSGTCVPVDGTAEIRTFSASGGGPGTYVPGLRRQWQGSATFRALPGTKLNPNTGYYVVMLAEGATRFSDTGNSRTALADGANLAGVTVNSMTRFKRNLKTANAWVPDEDDDPLRIALTLNAAAAPPAPAAEPADDSVDWKTSITVGNWSTRRGERERGWRVQDCVQTREDVSDIEDHSPDDICYGQIGRKQFTVGSMTYMLEGVYHGVSSADDSVTMEFEGEADLTALADRAFIINGTTFWMSGAIILGGIANAQAIVWPEPAWTHAGGWAVGSTVWVGLQVGTSRSRAAPTVEGTPGLSASGSDGSWTPGETVEAIVTFSEAVTVDTSSGTPAITLTLGGTLEQSARYTRGSGSKALVFVYTLIESDGSHTAMGVKPDSLALNGGSITSEASGADADLGHNGAIIMGERDGGRRPAGRAGSPATIRTHGELQQPAGDA